MKESCSTTYAKSRHNGDQPIRAFGSRLMEIEAPIKTHWGPCMHAAFIELYGRKWASAQSMNSIACLWSRDSVLFGILRSDEKMISKRLTMHEHLLNKFLRSGRWNGWLHISHQSFCISLMVACGICIWTSIPKIHSSTSHVFTETWEQTLKIRGSITFSRISVFNLIFGSCVQQLFARGEQRANLVHQFWRSLRTAKKMLSCHTAITPNMTLLNTTLSGPPVCALGFSKREVWDLKQRSVLSTISDLIENIIIASVAVVPSTATYLPRP